jgi:ADP-heptose:LPS heptosyltransferase
VAFSPVSRRAWKRWPAERFAEVCDRWAERAHVAVLPVFGPGEEPMIERVIARLRNRSIVANPGAPVSFGALAPLMARCAFYFGNDNGIRHGAIAVGIPTAAVFGPPSPLSWTPPGSARDVYAGGNCAIDTVSVDEVDAMLSRVIDSAQEAPPDPSCRPKRSCR